jgi:cobalt-zinc-cadmium resistance protein CzcA
MVFNTVQMRCELMSAQDKTTFVKYLEKIWILWLYADKMSKIVKTVEGTTDLYVETVTGIPQVVVEYNRLLIAQYGLNIEDINRIVNTAFAGQSTGMVYDENDLI